jgi:hypothetical protein
MPADKKDNSTTNIFERREFLKRAAVGAGAVAVGMVAMGCSSSSSSAPLPATSLGASATLPSASAWQFAVMADTQWLTADTDHLNPNTSAIGIINQLNQQFIAQGVKFVVQVGDLADQASGNSSEAGYPTTAALCEDTRGLFVQTLFNNGIGFFACRGNHDDGSAAEFVKLFPQTQSGQMNATPASAFSSVSAAYPAADASAQPIPAVSGSAFTQGSHFAAIGSPSPNLLGLSYGFDFNNARLLFIDQFTTLDKLNPDELTPYALGTTASQQQTWINNALAGKPSGGHAFVFTHKGLITQQHIDTLFGDCPADANFPAAANAGTGAAAKTYNVAAGAANAFIRSMAGNGARLYFCGHDHNHSRSLVKTTDSGAAAQITHVLCQSVSSKFYTPNEFNAYGNSNVPACTSNDAYFCAGKRQTMLSQELYTVGYYIVTVDGPNVTVDYYSAPAYPTYSAPTENMILTTPTLNFTKRETFGYSQIGKEFLVGNGGAFTVVQDAGPSGTTAAILSGTNSNPNTDPSGRKYYNDVTTGWYAESTGTASDVLVLWGMGYTLGSSQTDVYTLSMSYDATKGSSFVLGTPDANGNWAKAVDQNLGGASKAVTGPWKSSYALGTYGMDPATKTVWAVLNYNGCFAAIAGA